MTPIEKAAALTARPVAELTIGDVEWLRAQLGRAHDALAWLSSHDTTGEAGARRGQRIAAAVLHREEPIDETLRRVGARS